MCNSCNTKKYPVEITDTVKIAGGWKNVMHPGWIVISVGDFGFDATTGPLTLPVYRRWKDEGVTWEQQV